MSLTNGQYDEIFRKYDSRQTKNRHLLQARIEEIYKKIPRIAAIDKEFADLSVFYVEELLAGKPNVLISSKDRMKELSVEKKSLLLQEGYPSNYLEPIYDCKDCKDTGYIDGKKCHCLEQAIIDFVYHQSNLQNILKEENFSTFSYDYYGREPMAETGISPYDNARNAVKECKTFVNSFDSLFSNILFYGKAGTGKTFLSNCIARELLNMGYSVVYFTAFQLFDLLEKNKFDKKTDVSIHYQNIFRCDLLIIDDLGAEFSNSFTVSQLFLCLNERLLNKRSTIISTNLSINELSATYSERICSRIFSNYKLIKMFGDDIRIQKKITKPNPSIH